MKPSLLVIIMSAVAGLMVACNSAAAQPAAGSAQSLASGQVIQAQSQTGEAVAVNNAEASTAVQSQPAGPVFEPQANSEKAVTVEVSPVNLAEGENTWDFQIAFNTHSVNLDFDPAAISVLRDDRGREYPAVAWEGAGPGGHHRSGVVRFKVPDDATDFIEVVIHDVAGVPERIFRWNLKQD